MKLFALLIVLLLLLPPLPLTVAKDQPYSIGTPTQAQEPSTAGTAVPNGNAPSFQPQYIVLGRLEQWGIAQSSLPRSTPLAPGLLFSATYYTPRVLQDAYNVSPLLAAGYGGRGRSIAIIDAYGDPEIYQDLQSFSSQYGLPPVDLSIIPVGPYNPQAGVGTGWEVETALDVEAAHAMAPYAHINLIVAANASNAIFEAVRVAVTQKLGDTVSMSWGLPESLFGASGFSAFGFLNYPFTDHYFALGTSRGMSFFASSGDLGAFGGTPTTFGAATYPSTSPFVTSVGGTTLFVNVTSGLLAYQNATSSYSKEAGWSISPQYSGLTVSSGGGYSTLFSAPDYQSTVTNDTRRATPDVSAVGNPYTGMITIVEGQKLVVGGTSLSAPIWAGITADLDQYLGRSLGNLNPLLYSIYGNKSAYSSAFHQVPFGYNGLFSAAPGYNLVTGLGTPDVAGLASVLSGYTNQLNVSVYLSPPGPYRGYPQYVYGSTFSILAVATNPAGFEVNTGSFTARIYTPQGFLTSIPLSYNGTYWVGRYTVKPTDPPNLWRIDVSGSSGRYTGSGSSEVDIGLSVAYIAPVPYPYAPPIPPGQSFTIFACLQDPSGAPFTNGTLVAQFLRGNTQFFNVSLSPTNTSPGCYQGTTSLRPGMPQGTYVVEVSGQSQGSAYTYLYFGEAVVNATIISPTDQGMQSVRPGQQVTFLARPVTSASTGIFTSNVTAFIYDLKGNLFASAKLQPAPNYVQFGLYNFFQSQQANFTLPLNMTTGFYRVQFISKFSDQGRVQVGNFTTGMYVTNSSLSNTVLVQKTVLEGQYLKIVASITGPNGKPVTRGVFTATVEPTELNYASLLVGSITGVPMQYDRSSGVWVGYYQIPSVIGSSPYQGSPASSLAGPWNVAVAGESAEAVSVVPAFTYFNVLPYTYLGNVLLTPGSATSIPLLSGGSGSYQLNGAAFGNLTISGLTVRLQDCFIGGLKVKDSTVYLSGGSLGSVVAINSTLVLASATIQDSSVGVKSIGSNVYIYSSLLRNLTYAFSPSGGNISYNSTSFVNVSNLSTQPQPSFRLTSPGVVTDQKYTATVDVNGTGLRLLSLLLDGRRINSTVSHFSGGLQVSAQVDSASEPDGPHTITVVASNGLTYTHAFTIYNSYHSSSTIQTLTYSVAAALVLAALGLGGVVLLARRAGRLGFR